MALATPLLLGACTTIFGDGTPPKKELAQLDIRLQAGSQINPDDSGRPSPLLVRIYELRNEALFVDADFFGLYNNDKATLQGDMLIMDQFILRPGESRALYRKSNPQANAIGVLAAYRDLPNATWRAIYKLPPAREMHWYNALRSDEKVQLHVELQSKGVFIIDALAGRSSEPAANQQGRGTASPPTPGEISSRTNPVNAAQGPVPNPTENLLEQSKTLGNVKKLLPGP